MKNFLKIETLLLWNCIFKKKIQKKISKVITKCILNNYIEEENLFNILHNINIKEYKVKREISYDKYI